MVLIPGWKVRRERSQIEILHDIAFTADGFDTSRDFGTIQE